MGRRMTDQVAAIWASVDLLTKPTTVNVGRDGEADWLGELHEQFMTAAVCDIASWRAATRSYGSIPSLWDQSTVALTTGMDEGIGSKPLRERSPADLDLMEIRSIIRDTTRLELEKRGVQTKHDDHGRQVQFDQREIRSLASKAIAETDPDLEWWVYRFESWGRLLQTYLRVFEHQPRAVRLRNAPCPVCKTRFVTLESDLGPVQAPPLLIDFSSQGMIRAAECTACSATWWRGDQLIDLAQSLENLPVADETMSA